MAVWPVTLVQQPKASSYEESYLEHAIHSGMSVGRKNRLRDPSVMKTYKVRIPLDDTGKATFFGFWSTTISNGTEAFDWIKFDDGMTAASYRMLSDPDITATGSGIWEASLSLIDAEPQRVIDTTVTPAATTWPGSLPSGSAVSGYRESWNGYSLRSNLMQGKTSRSRGSFTEKRLGVSCLLTLDQKHTFEAWYEDDLVLGTLPFTHDGWAAFTSTRYVMLTPPKFKGLGAGLFEVNVELVSL